MKNSRQTKVQMARLIILPALLAGVLGFLLSRNATLGPAHAFSAGPPPGYTRAPGEEPEACAECHLHAGSSSGQISVTVPQTYTPGQTYQISVTQTSSDASRNRWGFQLTVLDPGDEKAGTLQNTTGLTQIIQGGPGGNREYIGHNSAGTFHGQQGGASWTFNWTAPGINAGVVTFYASGNQANGDGNNSGDFIYSTFVTSQPAASSPQLRFEQGATDPTQAAALDSLLLTRDPFRVQNMAQWWTPGPNLNTRVIVFAANLGSGSVVVNLVDAQNTSFDVPAEDVRAVANSDFSQITFTLPSGLAVGTCTVRIKVGSQVSNAGTFRVVS
ncbi:MAG: Reeler domain-containing protein [Acidobacteriota bacterium]